MARMSLFQSPLFLGFDEFEQVMDRVAKSQSDGYPPYNIEQVNDYTLRITLAVAGFTDDDLKVTVEDNQLIIRGRQEDDPNRTYIHRGIAARQFQRVFVLADGINVVGADLRNGLLSVDLERPRSATTVREIAIGGNGKNDAPKALELNPDQGGDV